ncbi:MAG: hypothetical protein D6785_06050 [Planctomycetota bacterium]|nr:MAG: hypothetical protein D6785_06050 [Planctomycetota bacterium]
MFRRSRNMKHATINRIFFLCFLALLSISCKGKRGPQGYIGMIGNPDKIYLETNLEPGADLPGLHVEILSIQGGSGSQGNFQPGDYITIRFRITTDTGRYVYIEDLDSARVLVSGPTSMYQKVLPTQKNQEYYDDLKTRAIPNYMADGITFDGTYTYTLPEAIPSVYPAPLNDTAKFGADHGELQGQPLLSGTYTLGIALVKNYKIGSKTFTDAANQVIHFLLGNATQIEEREVVKDENCSLCHEELRVHGSAYRTVKLCVLCHTAGAEDGMSTDSGDPTNITIFFPVMIHKIHNGSHLPSVNGIGTKQDGTRDYGVTPVPYQIMDGNGTLHNFSDVSFPVFPNLEFGMPKDNGYSFLSSADQAKEDSVRTGVTACEKCHGDPDGSGPLTAPLQGGNSYSKPSRLVCQSCHDDWDPQKPYMQNVFGGMPPQQDDSQCSICHPATGGGFTIENVHTHPLLNASYNKGINIKILSLNESGTNNGDGTLDPGEKISLQFTVKDDQGNDLTPGTDFSNLYLIISGPTNNRQLLLYTSLPSSALTGNQPYNITVPETIYFEFVGDSTATTGDIFTTSRTPHWNKTNMETNVYVRSSSGVSTTLSQNAQKFDNFLHVTSITGFNNGDYIVIDDGVAGKEEYLQIKWIDTSRNLIWFGSPYTSFGAYPPLRYSHSAGATVQQVTLTPKIENTDYTLDPVTGKITEVTEFGTGNAVVVSYTTDFIMPAEYSIPFNNTFDLDETWGKWTGKSLESGTYQLGLWGYRVITLNLYGETNTYRAASPPSIQNFLVGSATTMSENKKISSGENCNRCHNDVIYHGGTRKGFDTCMLCHGIAGAEDRAVYAQTTPDPLNKSTPQVVIEFRMLLHRIHMGKNLTNKNTYKVIGYQDQEHTYGDISFPVMKEGVKNCTTCHGDSNTDWKNPPSSRNHSTLQTLSVRAWRGVCGSCHDASSVWSHFDIMTTSTGGEACVACHDPGSRKSIEVVHKTR